MQMHQQMKKKITISLAAVKCTEGGQVWLGTV